MKNNKSKLLILSSLLFIVFLLLATIDTISFNKDFYQTQYEKLEIAEFISISDDDLMKTTNVLLDYIQDDNDDLTLIVQIDGIDREVFNKKEKDHMVDVKNLYLNAMLVKDICLYTFIVSILMLVYFKRKNALDYFLSSFIQAIKIFSILLVVVIFGAIVDFDALWRLMHKIFFTNDLWILDVNTDVMIMMFPLEFFNAIVTKIIIGFITSIAIVLSICQIVGHSRFLKRENNYD